VAEFASTHRLALTSILTCVSTSARHAAARPRRPAPRLDSTAQHDRPVRPICIIDIIDIIDEESTA